MPVSARVLALLLLLLLIPCPGRAEVYRWTDEQGRLHFSQSLAQVPARFREAARASAGEPRPEIQTYTAPARLERQEPLAADTLRIPFERQGSLMLVEARVNDRLSVPFFVDTGASGVSLPRAAVDALGLRIGADAPRLLVRTANGVVSEPIVRLDSVQLGAARVEGVAATVSDSMAIGLLGGSFFNNFVYAVDAAAGVLTLRPNEGIRAGAGAEEWRGRFRTVRAPLEELEGYLESREVRRPGRREELEGRRAELLRSLEALEREADLAGVPAAWRR